MKFTAQTSVIVLALLLGACSDEGKTPALVPAPAATPIATEEAPQDATQAPTVETSVEQAPPLTELNDTARFTIKGKEYVFDRAPARPTQGDIGSVCKTYKTSQPDMTALSVQIATPTVDGDETQMSISLFNYSAATSDYIIDENELFPKSGGSLLLEIDHKHNYSSSASLSGPASVCRFKVDSQVEGRVSGEFTCSDLRFFDFTPGNTPISVGNHSARGSFDCELN